MTERVMDATSKGESGLDESIPSIYALSIYRIKECSKGALPFIYFKNQKGQAGNRIGGTEPSQHMSQAIPYDIRPLLIQRASFSAQFQILIK
jgi:hypothetical protein